MESSRAALVPLRSPRITASILFGSRFWWSLNKLRSGLVTTRRRPPLTAQTYDDASVRPVVAHAAAPGDARRAAVHRGNVVYTNIGGLVGMLEEEFESFGQHHQPPSAAPSSSAYSSASSASSTSSSISAFSAPPAPVPPPPSAA